MRKRRWRWWSRPWLVTDRRPLVGVLALLLLSVMTGRAAQAQAQTARGASPRPGVPPRCFTREPQRVGPNAWAPALKQLAPVGASAIRLCGYDGLNASPRFKLATSSLIRSRKTVDQLVRELDALPPPRPGVFACPDDDGSQILALLAYPDGHEVTISASVTGCSALSNGDVTRTAGDGPPDPELMAQLERLSGFHRDI
jgi:hypothetical protein